MRFTARQYDEAIANLQEAKKQLEPEARNCRICHDSGHLAWECGHNPLLAMALCEEVEKRAEVLHKQEMHDTEDEPDADADPVHEFLHYLAGYNIHMGVRLGPARIVLPEATENLFRGHTEDRKP